MVLVQITQVIESLRDSNDDGILKKLNRGKTDKNKFYSQIQTKMKSKYIYLLYNFWFLIIVFCLGSSRVGKTSLIKR